MGFPFYVFLFGYIEEWGEKEGKMKLLVVVDVSGYVNEDDGDGVYECDDEDDEEVEGIRWRKKKLIICCSFTGR